MPKDQAWKLRDLIPERELYPRVQSDFHTKRLAITSGKGGVGKSVIALNLALLFAKEEQKTLLVDGDINLSKIQILTDTSPQFSYTDVKRGGKKLSEVIFEYQPYCSILPTGSGALELVNYRDEIAQHFKNQFTKLDGRFDYMLVDTASGISSLVFGELTSCDEVMIIATPEPTSIADAYAILKILSYYYPQIPVHIVFNLVDSEEEAIGAYQKFNLIVQKFLHRRIHYLGFLSRDENVVQSIKMQTPLALLDGDDIFIRQLDKIKTNWLEIRKEVSVHEMPQLSN